MDDSKLSRTELGEITKCNNEVKREKITEYDNNLHTTSEPEEENKYSIRDTIMFEEDLKHVIIDETSKKNEAEIGNGFSFRDSIIFKEEFPINLDYNTALQFQECLDMDIKPSLQLTPTSHPKDIEADLECQRSFRNAIVYKEDLDELYEDHYNKDDMIIGPELLQPTADQGNAGSISLCNTKVDNSKLNNKKQKAKGKQIYACICGTKSSRKKWFDEHACKKNVFVCDNCGKRFKTKFRISQHLTTHQTIREAHFCNICNKSFTFSGNLKRHLKIHLGTAKTYKCDKCCKTYKSNEYLQYHITNIHLEKANQSKSKNDGKERRFKCDICSNKYLGKTGLRLHIEGLHLGIKKFACQYCKGKYSSKWWLNSHEKKCKTSNSTVQLV